ncbi:hypothetical protein PAPYR_12001 [Paratrimastix pyriformis]|uniref:Uncharacterized protein n=1 Tax=Paratrimastix pyriformis TaxID=342808 RepID=A0ABQ8U2N6_9EUKA|nr:hypothetical protein PAPYR_12001 [Paratrimastix pyriformis]
MNHQKSSTGARSESGFDPCATLDDLARLLEPTPFLRLGPLAYTLPGRRRVPLKILVPTLHRMHFLATQVRTHALPPSIAPLSPRDGHARAHHSHPKRLSRSVDGPRDEPLRTAAPWPAAERIVELCRYDPSLMAYARLSHAQLHALTEGCLGLFDGWMRRQSPGPPTRSPCEPGFCLPGHEPGDALHGGAVGLPVPAKPSRCPLCTTSTWSDRRPSRRPRPDPERAGPPLVIDADQCPWSTPATGLLRRDETKPLTIQPVVQ